MTDTESAAMRSWFFQGGLDSEDTALEGPYCIDLNILKAVRALAGTGLRAMTCGQIYMQLVRTAQPLPPIERCVVAIDSLVKEGLIVSKKVLDVDPAFPYTQHVIAGLTEVGAACLVAKG